MGTILDNPHEAMLFALRSAEHKKDGPHTIECVYHADCMDGFTAAWVVHKKFGTGVRLHEGRYGEKPSEAVSKSHCEILLLVDFSYDLETMKELQKWYSKIVIIDHHKTAIEALKDFSAIKVFDIERSGAGLAWDTLFAPESRPDIVRYVEDRDLWRFALPGSKAVNAAYSMYSKTFPMWDVLAKKPWHDLVVEGYVVETVNDMCLDALVKLAQPGNVGGYGVPVVNAPPMFASELGNRLSKGEQFAAIYWHEGDEVHFSLRSRDGGLDVSEVAKRFGGGGHKHAAGFKVKACLLPMVAV